jgi:hypothetical protein
MAGLGLGMFHALALLASLVPNIAGQYLPVPSITPGIVDKRATVQAVCGTKWGKTRRHVTAAMRAQVFAAYGMTGNKDPRCQPKGCELDHLISRELGGADDVGNLWPQPNSGSWNAKHKDRLENRLRREVCHGSLNLEAAQEMERRDWIAAYRQYFGEP